MFQPSPKKIDANGCRLSSLVFDVLTADRPPLPGKDAKDGIFRLVAYHHAGPGLPLALPSEV